MKIFILKDTFQKKGISDHGIMVVLKKRSWLLFFVLAILSSNLFPDTLKEAKKAYSGRQYQKAVKLFQEYSKTNPSDGEPYMYLGYIYESLKEYNISTAYFRKASDLKLSPKQKKTVLLKLIIYFNYMHAWNYVVHYSNQYLILDPGNVEVEKILSKGRGNRGSDQIASVNIQYQDREKSYKQDKQKLSEPEPKPSVKESKNERVKEPKKVSNEETDLWDLALRSIEKGEYTNAFSFLSKLLDSNPDNKDYLYKAGIVKMRLKEYDKAVDYFDLALKNTNEKNETMYYYLYLNKGIALSKLEKFEQALDVLKKSYSYNKSFLPILIIIRLKYENGDYEDVLKYSKYVLNIDPENLESQMYKSISLLQLNNRKEGFKELLIFSKKLKITYPNLNNTPEIFHPGIHYLAVFYSGRKKYKLSNNYLSVINKSRSNYKSYIFTLGKNLFYLKDYEPAQNELLKLSDIPAANYLLSKIYLISNNLEKVKEFLLKATSKKQLYWSRILIDPAYKPTLQSKTDLSSFILNKGVNPIPVPPKEEVKMITPSPIENKQISEKTVDQTPNQTVPQNPSK